MESKALSAISDSHAAADSTAMRKRQSAVRPATRSVETTIAALPLERFDEYTLVGKIGHGGMAEVFLALSEGPHDFRKLLVIKRLQRHMKDDVSMFQMFMDEARLAARLNHPHVVQTNKVGVFEGTPFLAMEYLEGQSLSRLLGRSQESGVQLPLALGARIISDALDGLDYAHEARDYDGRPLGIVHRDISPHNLFLTYEGQVKLLDFGIAKTNIQQAHTRTGLIKGKFAYIAPEQASGEEVTAQADLWSMGVTLWEVLAGRRLFRGKTEVQTLQAVLSGPIPDLDQISAHCPPELAAVARRALQREPAERYASARAMKNDLDDWLESQSRASSRQSLSRHLRRLFAEKIVERQRAIQDCLERVDTPLAAEALPTSDALRPPESSADDHTRRATAGSGVVATSDRSPAADEEIAVTVAAGPQTPARRQRLYAWLVPAALLLLAFALGSIVAAIAFLPEADEQVASPSEVVPTAVAVLERPLAPTPTPQLVEPPPTPAELPEAEPRLHDDRADPSAAERDAPTTRRVGRDARRHPRISPRAEVALPAPAGPESAAIAAPAPVVTAPGLLSLDSTPWAIVSLDGRRLGITPLRRVELPAGTHELLLRNPERGVETRYRVTVTSGDHVERRVALE